MRSRRRSNPVWDPATPLRPPSGSAHSASRSSRTDKSPPGAPAAKARLTTRSSSPAVRRSSPWLALTLAPGLWSISRHPNYVGEIGLWTAQAFAASTLLSSPLVSGKLFPVYAAYAMFASPLAEYALINFVSGVPLLEASADKRFGDDPKYIEYKK